MQLSFLKTRTDRTKHGLIRQKPNLPAVWWIVVSVMNLILWITFSRTESLRNPADFFSVGNLLVAVLVQNDLILHLLYRLVISVSHFVTFGRYYANASVHYIGAAHAASASWGLGWLCISIVQHFHYENYEILSTTALPLLILLLSILLTALPLFRSRFQKTFKTVHRYWLWLYLAILAVHIPLLHFFNARHPFSLHAVITDPMFLMLILMIGSVSFPWLTLQPLDLLAIQRPSADVLILDLPNTVNVKTSAHLSTNLLDWHFFAIAGLSLNRQTRETNLRLIIGATEDCTRSLIDQIHQRNSFELLWMRSIHPPGFLFSIHAYSQVLVIATGAQIVSVLPYLASAPQKLWLLWVSHHPRETYGEEIWSILSQHPRLRVYDTKLYPEPEMGELALQAYREFEPEAIFCVSNQPVTQTVVSLCLAQGIPAYGAP